MSLAVPGPCFPLVLAGSLLLCSACGSPPPDSPEPFLEQGPIAPEQALQQEISAHEIHAYDLELSPGQLLELEAESHRIDLEVTLFDETGRPLAELASPARRWGPERLLAIGESSGPHRLEVRSLGDTKATGGTYQLFLLAPRPATASDALRASAQSLQNEGLALSEHDRTPTNEQALPRFRQALDLWRRAGDERGAARSLHWLGLVLKDLNRYPEAEEHFRSALELWRQLEAGPEEAETIYRLGALHRLAGRLEAARESFDQALTKWQEVGDLEREALTFYNLGLVDWHQASMQDALERFTRARELHRRLDQKEAEAKSLNAIAAVHQMLGQSDRALEGFRAVLAIQEELGDLENQAATLSNLGWIHHRSRGELGLAAEYFERALRLAREREDLREQASMLSNLGRVFLDLGDPRAAFDRATQSFELETRNQNPDGQMGSLIVLGLALQAMEKPAEAIGSFEQALALSRALGTRTSEAEILYFLARSHRSSGELEDARSAIGQSLSILEALRTDVDSRSLKSTFLGFRRPYYELEIEVLVSLARLDPAGGFAGKALWASERARARALLETLAEMGDDFRTGVDAELLADAQTLRRQINELEHERWTADEAEQPTITRRLREQLEALEATELEIRRQSPRYADLARPRPLGLE